MRFLLANLLYPNEDVNYRSLNRLIPDFHQQHRWAKLGIEDPLIVKSHRIWQGEYLESKVIYLYRDPRDVALSCYHFDMAGPHPVIDKDWSFDRYLKERFFKADEIQALFDEYLIRQTFGTNRIDFFGGSAQWGRWGKHVHFWTQILHKKHSVFLVSYEELWKYTYAVMIRIANFLGIEMNSCSVVGAILKSSFDELEKIRARDGVDPKIKGLRGKPEGWKKMLTEEQNELIWKQFSEIAEKLGYRKER